jgi:ABC-2 type transport system permease protein
VLLDRPDPLGAPMFLGYASPAIAIAAAVAAGLTWQAGVRHYRSTGS